jgi:uncharacterized membrane protein
VRTIQKRGWEWIRHNFLPNFFLGIVLITPLIVTYVVVRWVLQFADTFLFNLLPSFLRPESLFGFRIPGLGIVLVLLLFYIVGATGRNYIAQKWIQWLEERFQQVPFLRGVYFSTRKLLEAIFQPREGKLNRVVLVDSPLLDLKMLGFWVGEAKTESGESYHVVFIPTAPNPTSGFVCFVSKEQLHHLSIPPEETVQFLLSLGASMPSSLKGSTSSQEKV